MSSNNKGSATQGSQSGDSGTYGFGFERATGTSGVLLLLGQMQAVEEEVQVLLVLQERITNPNGGAGKDMSAIFGTSYGESGFFSGGGAGSNQARMLKWQ